MAEYLVRASALEGYNRIVEEHGADPARLRESVGISAAPMSVDSWISYHAFLQLLENSALELDCPHFGLLLSREQGISILGPVGFVMREAATVGQALEELGRYFAHHNQGADVSISVEGQQATWAFISKMPGYVRQRQQTDLVMGIGLNIMRLLCGGNWSPDYVYMSHARPANMRIYRQILNCPANFDGESNMMLFPAKHLQTPIAQADGHLHQILENHLSMVKESFPNSYTDQIRHLIRQALLTGDCSVDRVAAYLSVTKRTLQRRLKAEGVSYRELIDQVRLDMATHYLRESNSSLTTLADMLGYSELSAFSNAFKQQTGVSPREWRAQFAR